MHRDHFRPEFSELSFPTWRCPFCGIGTVAWATGATNVLELESSKPHRSRHEWEPEWIESSYSSQMKCSHGPCSEITYSSGKSRLNKTLVEDECGNPEQYYEEMFTPAWFFPALPIIDIPANCPDAIKGTMKSAFMVFFASPDAAASLIRQTVEEILTHLKVKQSTRTKKGKLQRLTTHQRIEYLPNKFESLSALLMGIKWIGNAGSHSTTSLNHEQALDGFVLMENVLQLLFPTQESPLQIAKRVNAKRGPMRSRKRNSL